MSNQITRIERTLRKNKKLTAILVIAALLLMLSPQILQSLSSTMYPTAYEGAKSRFIGIKDLSTEKIYTNTQKHDASVASFDTQINFDIDEADKYMCNIAGEMTSVFIPKTDAGLTKDWVPTSWWRDAMLWQNPQKTYEWTVKNDDGTTSFYRMEEWVTKWFFTLSAEWDSGPDIWGREDEAENRRYRNMQIWFEFDIEPTWYFNGTDLSYFAIAKVQLSDIAFAEKLSDDTTRVASDTIRVTPMSPGSILTLYHNPYGEAVAVDETEFTSYYYKNVQLNPQYFRDKVYSYITLNDFGTRDWYHTIVELRAKGDVVTFGFTVTQFVVGEWLVKDIQEIPDEYGRTPKVGVTGWTGLGDIFDFLGSPLGQLWLFLILIGVALVLVTIFFPGFWILIFSWFQRTRRKGGDNRS